MRRAETGERRARRLSLTKDARGGLRKMNRFERHNAASEAELDYLDGEYRIRRPGAFVRCAVTGQPIPLDDLRYWNVDLQEAYATPEAKLKRLGVGKE